MLVQRTDAATSPGLLYVRTKPFVPGSAQSQEGDSLSTPIHIEAGTEGATYVQKKHCNIAGKI